MRLKSILITLAVLISTAALAQWTALKGPSGGWISKVKTDPVNSKLYAISAGTLFVSDFGDTWTETNFPSRNGFVDVIPNGNQITTLAGDGIRTSTDGGQTWTQTFNEFHAYYSLLKSTVGNQYFYQADPGIIQVSVDGGITFKQICSNAMVGVYWTAGMQQASNGDLYAFNDTHGLMKLPYPSNPNDLASWSSTNWVDVHPPGETQDAVWFDYLGLAIGPNDKLYCSYRDDAVGLAFATSPDGGATWTTLPMTGYTGAGISSPLMIVTPAGKLLVLDNSFYRAFEYTDGAPTPWVSKPWPTSVRSSQVVDWYTYRNSDLYVGTRSDGIFKTSNAGASWAQSADGILKGASNQAAVLDNGKIIIIQGVSPLGFYYSLDNGNIWSFKSTTFKIYNLIKLPDNTLFATDDNYGIHVSTDGGDTWNDYTSPLQRGYYVVVAANDIYGFDNDGAIAESIDKGQTWTSISSTGLPATYYVKNVARDADGYYYLDLNASDGVNYTNQTWRLNTATSPWTGTAITMPVPPAGSNYTYTSWTFVVAANKLYATAPGYTTYMSTDHGATWKNLNINGTVMPISGGLAIITKGNIAITQDDGLTVRNVQLPVDDAVITQLATNAAGGFYVASAQQSPALKFTGSLTLPASALQPYINYGWQTVPGGPFGGMVNSVKTTSTGGVFAVSLGRLYRYDNANTTWQKLNLSADVADFVIDASDNIYATIYPGTVVKSTDGGNSFNVQGIATANSNGLISQMLRTNSGSVFVANYQALYKSTNDGVTFTQIATGDHMNIAVSGSGSIFSVISGQDYTQTLHRSTDGGTTWSAADTGIDADQKGVVQLVAPAESNVMITITTTNIYRSTDDGATWTSIKNNLPSGANGVNAQFVLTPTGDYLVNWASVYYASTDHGSTWARRTTTQISGVYVDIAWQGSTAYAATSTGIYKSVDNAATFQAMTPNGILSLYLTQVDVVGNRLFTVEANGHSLLISNDHGSSWSVQPTGLKYANGFIKTPDNSLYAYGDGFSKSTDGGTTWTKLPQPPEIVQYGMTIKQMCSSDGVTFYAFGQDYSHGNKFYKTTDLVTWSVLPSTGWQNSFVIGDMVNDDVALYASLFGGQSDVYRIAFGLASKVDEIKSISSLKKSGNTIYALTGNGTLYEKSGSTWAHKAVPYGWTLSTAARNQLYITGGLSIFVSRDDGVTWQDIGQAPAMPSQVVSDEFSGIAYGATTLAGVIKSTAIVYPDDKTGPVTTAISPVDGTTTVAIDSKLTVTFDEAAFPMSGKNLRVYVAGAVSAAYVIDATQATRADKTYTFTLPAPGLVYSTNYYVVIDNGAFKDLFGNAYTGISDQTSWNFTTVEAPDLIPPSVQATGGNLEVGSGNREIDFSVTDNKSVATTAKFYVRDITTKDFGPPQVLTGNPTSGTMKFSAFITEDTYKKIGVAYYFEVTDLANNLTRYPADPTAYAYSYLTYPQSKNPTLPALPTGGSVEDYRMISLPYQFEDNKISTLFSALGEPDNKAWRLLTHGGGSTTNWLEYSSGGITTIERGTGYWINVKNATTISFNGSSVAANNPSAWFSMLLKPGWNQVGDPYTIQISWDEIRATNSNIGKLKVLKDNAYSDSPTLDPYGAGFVFLSGSAPVSIPITFPGFSAGRIAGVQFGTDLGSDIWKLPITIEQGNANSNFSGIGMHNDASEDFDGFDDLNPPPFVKLLQVNFPHPQSDPKKLALDIVPTQAGHQWSFTVDTDTNEEVKLSWDNSGLGNNSKEIFLLDENSQTLVNMREVSSYSFKPITSHPFKLFFGENLGNRIMPTRILTGDPYPNPTNGVVSLPFTLSEDSDDYRVSLDILDVMGRPVGRMADQIMSPGFHTTTWMADETTTTGLYLLRIKIQGKEKSYVETKRIVLKR